MTREQFINRFKHEVAGLVLDALRKYDSPATISMFADLTMRKVEKLLGEGYDTLKPPSSPPLAGTGGNSASEGNQRGERQGTNRPAGQADQQRPGNAAGGNK